MFVELLKHASTQLSKSKNLTLLVLCSFLALNCGKDEDLVAICENLSDTTILSEQEAYFIELTLDNLPSEEIPRLKKWQKDIAIFIEGTPNQELLSILNAAIVELNLLDGTIKIDTVSSLEAANLRFFFGTPQEYAATIEPNITSINDDVSSIVTIASNNVSAIERASICNDHINFPDLEFQQHSIRQVLARSLGLKNPSTSFTTSIFNDTITTNTAYSPLDREMIELMLGTNLKPGFCPNTIVKAIN